MFTAVKLRHALLIVAELFLMPTLADAVEEYTAKSAFALNLARFTEWPPKVFKDNATINFCVLGDEVVQQIFILLDKRQIDTKTLSVININNTKELDQCQVLYVNAETIKTAQLIEESLKRHILTIGETDNFLEQGGMVYLEINDAKINLHINLSATNKAGVTISSRVLKLTTIFRP